MEAEGSKKNGTGKRALQYAFAIVGTVLVSVAGAFFAFGQQQQSQIERLELSEAEDARQREVDQQFATALQQVANQAQTKVAELESRLAILETKVEHLEGK
jgi:uncharacterized protein HemX